jgi:hypothetical protein
MADAQKRIEAFLDTVVAWGLSRQPRLRDEPQAYRAACIRQGAELALCARLGDDFMRDFATTTTGDSGRADG